MNGQNAFDPLIEAIPWSQTGGREKVRALRSDRYIELGIHMVSYQREKCTKSMRLQPFPGVESGLNP